MRLWEGGRDVDGRVGGCVDGCVAVCVVRVKHRQHYTKTAGALENM